MVRKPYVALSLVIASITIALASIQIAACSDPTRTEAPQEEAPQEIENVGNQAERLATTSSEYQFKASRDNEIFTLLDTEVWARVYRPATLEDKKAYPLLVFLHGNHGTCGTGTNPHVDVADGSLDYTMDGGCPAGFSVVRNHEGYGYIADDLAAAGYIVVSINTNRGINGLSVTGGDPNLIAVRGRLVLKHLALLAKWNRGDEPTPTSLGVDLTGHLDFGHVGLLGHSRGGAGVRKAFEILNGADSTWRDKIKTPVNVEGIFEIGPTDEPGLNAINTRWAVLLPMCDDDVSDLEGTGPFDRMAAKDAEATPSFKATLAVWGTNHNYYNTEWQTSESIGCLGPGNTPLFTEPPDANIPVQGVTGSAKQRQIGNALATTFFKANVGAARNQALNAVFNPANTIVGTLGSTIASITRIDRGFLLSPAPNLSRSFASLADAGSTNGTFQVSSNVTAFPAQVPDHGIKGVKVTWTPSMVSTFVELDFAPASTGVSLYPYTYLDFRVDRAKDPSNPTTATNLSVALVRDDGTLTPAVPASNVVLTGPAETKLGPDSGIPHSILQTARIPLTSFSPTLTSPIDTSKFRGVRFILDSMSKGAIYLHDVRLSANTSPDAGAGFATIPTGEGYNARAVWDDRMERSVDLAGSGPSRAERLAIPRVPMAGHLVSFNRARAIPRFATRAVGDEVAIEVESDAPFPIVDAPTQLHVGDFDLYASELSDFSDVHRLVFTLSAEQHRMLREGQDITVTCGSKVWKLGTVTKAHLAR